ncbi:hypothetical protein GGI15_004126 [Coemansia interrupta]|uniref:Yeast cell wall synthesis Kre9/Knh1-like N-terminal domain-containing protein n=1 Tax=Coemansia interrupta TaxID=1126814 RepID=A0A9W8H7M2_9FUNG|nr:hypothetical protein GGI15_004126 [Coemansia interrupta]
MKLVGICTISALAATAFAKLQIVLPNSHTEWEAGSPGTIKWKDIEGGLKGRLSIDLMEGSDPSNMSTLATIAENVPASSLQKSWNVPKNFKNSNNYSIRIVDEDGESYYGQYFKGVGGKTEVGKKSGKNSAANSKSQPQDKGKDSSNKQGARDENKNSSMPLKSSGPDSDKDKEKEKDKDSAANSAPLSVSTAAIAYAAAAVAAGALAIC